MSDSKTKEKFIEIVVRHKHFYKLLNVKKIVLLILLTSNSRLTSSRIFCTKIFFEFIYIKLNHSNQYKLFTTN
jgi:hypothetical protein